MQMSMKIRVQTQMMFAFLWLGLVGIASAQKQDEDFHKKRKEIHQKVHSYIKKNVFPVVKAQRAKLESKLSADHKKRITELRAEVKPLRKQLKTKHQALRKACENGETPSESQRQELHEIHKKMRKIRLEAWTIADQYDTQIKKLHEEIKPQKETWKSEIKSIFEENMTDEMRQKMKEQHKKCYKDGDHSHRNGQGKEGHRGGKRHHKGLGLRKMMSPPHFILLDPNAEMPDLIHDFEKED